MLQLPQNEGLGYAYNMLISIEPNIPENVINHVS